MKKSKSKFEKTLDKICRGYGYPHIKLNYEQYHSALKEAHEKSYGKPIHHSNK